MIRLLTYRFFWLVACYSFSTHRIAAFTSSPSSLNKWSASRNTQVVARISSEDIDQAAVDDDFAIETSLPAENDIHHVASSHQFQNYSHHVSSEETPGQIEAEQSHNNVRIHLPERLSPGVGWKHHQEATIRLFRGNDDEDEHIEPEEPKQHGGNPVSKFFKQYIMRPQLVSVTAEWKRLQKHAEEIEKTHLRDMLQDKERCDEFFVEEDGVYVDYSRQRASLETMDLLLQLAEKQDLKGKIDSMVNGEKINFTEKRAVLHTALRADRDQIGTVFVDEMDAIGEVHEVLDQIKYFTDGVRAGTIRGCTGRRLRNIVSVGIGGSYLGPEFLHESLKTEPEGINAALGYSLRFLSNVDPVDVERTCADLDPEETLIVIVSKTFTTSETMLNARTMRQWLWDFMGNDKEVVRKHFVACASISSMDNVAEFGIDTENYFFRFWDWVGGRYSVCSAAGAVPISLLYGYDLFEKFLKVSFEVKTESCCVYASR